MVAQKLWGYVLGVTAVVASCGGEGDSGSPVDATPTGGVSSSSGSPSISGSSGSVAQQGGSLGSQTGGRSAATGGTVGSAGASGTLSSGGSSAGSPSDSPDAGATGEPGGEGGSGQTPSSTEVEQYRACIDYFVAQCGRRSACNPSSPESSCLAVSLARCPDLLFAAGSRLSVAVVDGCAEAWKDADCDEVNRGSFPACGYPDGALEPGMPCAFSSQCETLACGRFEGDDCGVCLPLLEQGDDCAASQGACPAGTDCTGTCEPSLPFNLPAGSACEVVGQCEEGYVCRSEAQGRRTCQPLFAIGENCEASWECAEGYCDADSNRCAVGAAIGAPCAEDGWGHLRSCAADAICDDRQNPAVCTARVGATEPCWVRSGVIDSRGNCTGELQCLCTDPSCAERECRFERRAGQACNDEQSLCITGTECRDAVCEPTGIQDLFEAACTP